MPESNCPFACNSDGSNSNGGPHCSLCTYGPENYSDRTLRLNTTQLGTPVHTKPAFLCVGKAMCKVYELLYKGNNS
jgi:hypothetical protein